MYGKVSYQESYDGKEVISMKLIKPEGKYYDSYIEAMNELKDNNVTTHNIDDSPKEVLFKKLEDSKKGINLPEGWVPCSTYWLVDNDEFIGQLAIRHRLTENLRNYAGHIGYVIRYSKWNKGYGTLMLKLGLKKAKELGIDKVLITCNDDNYGSARVIEKNGGILEDKVKNVIDGKEVISRRYWIELK